MSVAIDLIPEGCRLALGRRARVHRWAMAYLAGAAMVGLGYASAVAGDVANRRERDELARQVREKWERNEEAKAVLAQIKDLEGTIARYERLAWPVRASEVVAAIGSRTPESVTLTALTLTPRTETTRTPPKPGEAKRGKAKVESVTRTLMAIELEGLAPDDMQLALFVSGLESYPMFRAVVLDFARSREVDGVPARGFRVTCEIDLSTGYTFVREEAGVSP
jgi:peptidyl-tRNA hydrolase